MIWRDQDGIDKLPGVGTRSAQSAGKQSGMLSEDLDAATAGYRVGYNDASHFSREYKRFFGRPPLRDVERLREASEKEQPATM